MSNRSLKGLKIALDKDFCFWGKIFVGAGVNFGGDRV